VDHGLALSVGLAQPQAAARHGQRRVLPVLVAGFDLLVTAEQGGGHRVQDGYAQDPDRHGCAQGRQQKLPDRNTGRPRHDQLVLAGQTPEGRQAREEHREGHDLLDQIGQPEQDHRQHDAEADVRLVGHAVEQIDGADQNDDTAQAAEESQPSPGELPRDIAEQRWRQVRTPHPRPGAGADHGGVASAGRRRGRRSST
jgi:hypothetical protein